MKNMADSIYQRLLNRSREEGRPFQELLQYYAMERFLYRLSQSTHRDNFILKGAMMLQVWESPQLRPTKDIDFLGRMNNSPEDISKKIIEVLGTAVQDDGITFDDKLRVERIKEEAEYHGVRVSFKGFLKTARVNMQIDIGFGDTIYPEPSYSRLPVQLDQEPPVLLCYSMESVIAEKLEAMIKLGTFNSRMKDFFDVWLLSKQFVIKGSSVLEAVKQTLANRKTRIPDSFIIFHDDFIQEKQPQWKAFVRRMKIDFVSQDFSVVLNDLRSFIDPLLDCLKNEEETLGNWSPGGSWL